ncbi:hypothetical protein RUMCAL_03273 [Ruminococcus callidus ATCC 27760]|uniref:Uncharacterized protein n=1 Tax=Ruminococcus callidus ATCC 27760 TaxID=411473 RepID=U2JN13_9FIRM|nr:hypothetical protein RUMCAL_03273 [Ruminococcus callidus ATCC 27760]
MLSMLILHQVLFQVSREKYSTGIFLIGFLLEKGNQGEPRKSIFMIASPERGGGPPLGGGGVFRKIFL